MVFHSSHTNHEFLILVIRVTNVSLAIESFATYEKVLIIMLHMERIILLLIILQPGEFILCYESFFQKTGRINETKILKNTRKESNTYEIAGLTCINFELKIGNKTCNFVALYRSPSQSQDVFEIFCENFERTLDNLAQNNLFLLIAIGDCNSESTNWCANDQISFEGNKTEHITSQFGLGQIINEPTHILDSSSSCIHLIFTSQPNLVIKSGIHPSLHQNCHHQIIYAQLDLQIFYPPPYCREIWHSQELT